MKRHPFLTGFLCMAVFCVVFVAAVWAMTRFNLTGTITQGTAGKVAIVDIEGVISESREIIDRLHNLRDDDSVAAIVVRIDSPGGTVGPAQEIHAELIKLQKLKPVVTSMGSVAASGGYYIAAATQRIFANPGTITGSIGVLVEAANFEELLGKIGLHSEVIKSGAYKDTLSPTRTMQSDERALIQAVVDNIHAQFVKAVAEGRSLPRKKVLSIADGRILSGEQALEAGLVDEMGNLYDAIQSAADLAGIKGKPEVVYPKGKKPSLLDFLLETRLNTLFEQYRGMTAEYMMFR
ncbi:MAG: signal peptide peptidase SppA [Deltaproteobacteria bacterium]|nr:signal peptide peptidase SppA [Deltaproteobacteria bacterium]